MKKAEKYDELLKKYNIQDSRDLEKVMKVYYQQSENVTAEEVEISEELMVQYGISSMEEFTKARELNVFKENFVHVSESDQSKFDYVKGILERSKNAIFAYLELLPEYDVSEPVNLTNTIFIIKKYGKEIVLITRPSDYEHGFPVTIIEALNLNSLNKAYLDKHIDKIYNYDTAGNKFNIILSYVTASNFIDFCDKYFEHIKKHKYPFAIQVSEDNVVIEECSFSDIKVMKTVHNRNGCETVLYHVCIWIK